MPLSHSPQCARGDPGKAWERRVTQISMTRSTSQRPLLRPTPPGVACWHRRAGPPTRRHKRRQCHSRGREVPGHTHPNAVAGEVVTQARCLRDGSQAPVYLLVRQGAVARLVETIENWIQRYRS